MNIEIYGPDGHNYWLLAASQATPGMLTYFGIDGETLAFIVAVVDCVINVRGGLPGKKVLYIELGDPELSRPSGRLFEQQYLLHETISVVV